jgi:hypothetical protein
MKMPNWCDNKVFLSHENPEMIDRVVKGYESSSLMNEFFPCPKELTETTAGFLGKGTYEQELLELRQQLNIKWFGHSNWYDWCNANWGTKWDVGAECGGGDGFIGRGSPNDVYVSFLSAWGSPIGFYEKLEDLGFEVKAYYYEAGMAFCGKYQDGEDESYSIDGNSNWVIENIPEDIDNEMGISEGMASWEERERHE